LHMVVINLCKDEGRRTKAEELRKLHKKRLLIINLVASVDLPVIHHADAFSETPVDLKSCSKLGEEDRQLALEQQELQMLGFLLCHLRRISIYKYRKENILWEGGTDYSLHSSSSTDGQEDDTNQEGANSLAVVASRRRDGIGSVEFTCFSESEDLDGC